MEIIERASAIALVAVLCQAPVRAETQHHDLPLSSWYPGLVASVDVYGQSGRFATGFANTDQLYGARAYDVSLGARFGEHLLVAFRGQEAWVDVSLPLASPQPSQTIHVHSRSYGLRTVVAFSPFDWDTTASVGYNDNFTNIPQIFPPDLSASWKSREWAVVSTVGAKLPVGFLLIEPRAGARVYLLHDQSVTEDILFRPEQVRSTTTWLVQAKLSAPIRLDQSGVLTPWIAGEISRTTNPHPPTGFLTDLSGMAGGHYVVSTPDQEGPGAFPAQTWRTASAGLRLDVTPSFTMDASAIWSGNDAGHWMAYQWTAAVRF